LEGAPRRQARGAQGDALFGRGESWRRHSVQWPHADGPTVFGMEKWSAKSHIPDAAA